VWVDEKALYLVAHFDATTAAALGGCYRALQAQGFSGRQTQDIPHHLTLGSYEVGREAWLCAEIERVCGETEAIDIRLDHLGLFGLDVLFVGPNVNRELLDLHSRFFAQGIRGAHPWCAHATILIDEPDVILRALPILAQNFAPGRARIESLALYECFPARLIKECPLRGALPGILEEREGR
jgi:2'-5' RNA ligase